MLGYANRVIIVKLTVTQSVHETMKYATFRYDTVEVDYRLKGRFPLQPYRSETWRISLFHEHSGRTNHMDTIEFR